MGVLLAAYFHGITCRISDFGYREGSGWYSFGFSYNYSFSLQFLIKHNIDLLLVFLFMCITFFVRALIQGL